MIVFFWLYDSFLSLVTSARESTELYNTVLLWYQCLLVVSLTVVLLLDNNRNIQPVCKHPGFIRGNTGWFWFWRFCVNHQLQIWLRVTAQMVHIRAHFTCHLLISSLSLYATLKMFYAEKMTFVVERDSITCQIFSLNTILKKLYFACDTKKPQ